jgi:hypothetical protein
VVALGLRGDDFAATQAGAHAYVQVGASPREVLEAVERAFVTAGSRAKAEQHLLADAHPMLEEPALVDL